MVTIKTKVKVSTVLLIIIILFAASCAKFSAFNIYTYSSIPSYNAKLISDDKSVYLVSFNKNLFYIEMVLPNMNSNVLTLNYNIVSYSLNNGVFYIACNDAKNNQCIIYKYNVNYDDLSSFAINNVLAIEDFQTVSCDSNYFYIISNSNTKKVFKYSLNGKKLFTYNFDRNINALICSDSNLIYALSNNIIYKNNGDYFNAISSGQINVPADYVGGSIFIDRSGYIVNCSDRKLLAFCGYATDNPSASICNNMIVTHNGENIIAYDIYNGKKSKYFNFNSNILQVKCCNNDIAVMSQNSNKLDISILSFSQLKSYENSSSKDKKNDKYNENNSNDNNGCDISGKYVIDFKNYYISDIAKNTTISTFKKNINYSGYSLQFFTKDGKQRKSGNLGTAMKAVFTDSNNNSYTFELSVVGDITGEGNVNTRDLDLMMDYLLKDAYLTGVYSIAADIKQDNTINSVDLLFMLEMYKGKR